MSNEQTGGTSGGQPYNQGERSGGSDTSLPMPPPHPQWRPPTHGPEPYGSLPKPYIVPLETSHTPSDQHAQPQTMTMPSGFSFTLPLQHHQDPAPSSPPVSQPSALVHPRDASDQPASESSQQASTDWTEPCDPKTELGPREPATEPKRASAPQLRWTYRCGHRRKVRAGRNHIQCEDCTRQNMENPASRQQLTAATLSWDTYWGPEGEERAWQEKPLGPNEDA